MLAHGTALMLCPDGVLLRLRERRQAVSPAQHDPVIGRHRGREVVHAVRVSVNVWIRALRDPYVIIGKFSVSTHSISPLLRLQSYLQ